MQNRAIIADHIAFHFEQNVFAIFAEGPTSLASIACKRQTI